MLSCLVVMSPRSGLAVSPAASPSGDSEVSPSASPGAPVPSVLSSLSVAWASGVVGSSSSEPDVQPDSTRAPAATIAMVVRLIFNVPPIERTHQQAGSGPHGRDPAACNAPGGVCRPKLDTAHADYQHKSPQGDPIVTEMIRKADGGRPHRLSLDRKSTRL